MYTEVYQKYKWVGPYGVSMKEDNASNLESGDYININGTVHEISDVSGDVVTIINEGTVTVDYLQGGIDNGKVTIC